MGTIIFPIPPSRYYTSGTVSQPRLFVSGSVYLSDFNKDTERTVEWICEYCHSPNETSKRFCSQCGAPRALLIQEMK